MKIGMYKVDSKGRPLEHVSFSKKELSTLGSEWVPDTIQEEFPYPRWNFEKKTWENGTPSREQMSRAKSNKKSQLSTACNQNILEGFKVEIGESVYQFSYDLDNQQNFSDTMRLFDNNMIDSIGWNAYLDGEKKRIQLSKEEFTRVYLEGVKHKTNCLTTLNDYLYPLVDSAKSEDELELIYWGENIYADDMDIDDSKTIEKKTNKLEIDNSRNANGILELTNMILMGGM